MDKIQSLLEILNNGCGCIGDNGCWYNEKKNSNIISNDLIYGCLLDTDMLYKDRKYRKRKACEKLKEMDMEAYFNDKGEIKTREIKS